MQLRRPSDKAVSDPRNFDFTPIELSSLAAKRRKTNYSVFNSILSCDQEQLRRKRSSSSLMSPDSTHSPSQISGTNLFCTLMHFIQMRSWTQTEKVLFFLLQDKSLSQFNWYTLQLFHRPHRLHSKRHPSHQPQRRSLAQSLVQLQTCPHPPLHCYPWMKRSNPLLKLLQWTFNP